MIAVVLGVVLRIVLGDLGLIRLWLILTNLYLSFIMGVQKLLDASLNDEFLGKLPKNY